MNTKDAQSLKKGDKVFHKEFGDCEVVSYVHNFGPVIIPTTPPGKKLLSLYSGMPESTPYLASDYKRNLKHKP